MLPAPRRARKRPWANARTLRAETTDAMPQVCVVGVGFVGEHLASIFARKFRVLGYDTSAARVKHLQRVHRSHPNLEFATSPEKATDASLFCIAVPTPLKAGGAGGIDLTCLEAAAATVARLAKPGTAIVVESSVAVGTTRRILAPLREHGLYIGFSPERMDPGRVDPPAETVPKILAGYDEASMVYIRGWYEAVFARIVPVSTLETAEMSKLFENCFRLVNIAYVNEIADACAGHGIDPHEVVTACATKPYGYMPFTPGLGAGGPCIPVNPHYLLANNDLPLLQTAMIMNAGRPAAMAAALGQKYPSTSRVLVSGIGFKPGEALTTHSPGLAFAQALKRLGRSVTLHDPVAAAGKTKLGGLAVLDEGAWNAASLTAGFDLVAVATLQAGVDYEILAGLAMPVEWLCTPIVGHNKPAAGVADAQAVQRLAATSLRHRAFDSSRCGHCKCDHNAPASLAWTRRGRFPDAT